jgi:hypothetical protein
MAHSTGTDSRLLMATGLLTATIIASPAAHIDQAEVTQIVLPADEFRADEIDLCLDQPAAEAASTAKAALPVIAEARAEATDAKKMIRERLTGQTKAYGRFYGLGFFFLKIFKTLSLKGGLTAEEQRQWDLYKLCSKIQGVVADINDRKNLLTNLAIVKQEGSIQYASEDVKARLERSGEFDKDAEIQSQNVKLVELSKQLLPLAAGFAVKGESSQAYIDEAQAILNEGLRADDLETGNSVETILQGSLEKFSYTLGADKVAQDGIAAFVNNHADHLDEVYSALAAVSPTAIDSLSELEDLRLSRSLMAGAASVQGSAPQLVIYLDSMIQGLANPATLEANLGIKVEETKQGFIAQVEDLIEQPNEITEEQVRCINHNRVFLLEVLNVDAETLVTNLEAMRRTSHALKAATAQKGTAEGQLATQTAEKKRLETVLTQLNNYTYDQLQTLLGDDAEHKVGDFVSSTKAKIVALEAKIAAETEKTKTAIAEIDSRAEADKAADIENIRAQSAAIAHFEGELQRTRTSLQKAQEEITRLEAVVQLPPLDDKLPRKEKRAQEIERKRADLERSQRIDQFEDEKERLAAKILADTATLTSATQSDQASRGRITAIDADAKSARELAEAGSSLVKADLTAQITALRNATHVITNKVLVNLPDPTAGTDRALAEAVRNAKQTSQNIAAAAEAMELAQAEIGSAEAHRITRSTQLNGINPLFQFTDGALTNVTMDNEAIVRETVQLRYHVATLLGDQIAINVGKKTVHTIEQMSDEDRAERLGYPVEADRARSLEKERTKLARKSLNPRYAEIERAFSLRFAGHSLQRPVHKILETKPVMQRAASVPDLMTFVLVENSGVAASSASALADRASVVPLAPLPENDQFNQVFGSLAVAPSAATSANLNTGDGRTTHSSPAAAISSPAPLPDSRIVPASLSTLLASLSPAAAPSSAPTARSALAVAVDNDHSPNARDTGTADVESDREVDNEAGSLSDRSNSGSDTE